MSHRSPRIWTLAACAALATLGYGAWRTSDFGRAASSLEGERAAAKRAGVPMDWEDVRRLTPPVPFGQNAATLYTQAFASLRTATHLRKLKMDDLLSALAKGDAKPADLEAARSALAEAAPALEEVRAGSRRKAFSYDREWEKGSMILFPEYSDERGAVRALVLRAMLAEGPEAAVDDLRAAARMRAQFGSEPVLIAALVGNGIETDIHRAVWYLGRRGGVWPRAVAPVLDDLGPIPSLRRSLTAEAVMGMHFDEEIARSGPDDFSSMNGSTPAAMRLMTVKPFRDAAMARIFEYWREAWPKLPSDPTDFRATREALKMPPPDSGPSYTLVELLFPVFDNFAQTNAESEARRRLSREALALWSGKTPTLETDPFGNGPLKLKRSGKGWTLYSVGPDGMDNGGAPRAGNVDKGYDLVVRS